MKQQDLQAYYQGLVSTHLSSQQSLKKQGFWLGVLRFISFALFAWALVSWIVSGTSWLFTLPSFGIFLFLVSIDSKVGKKLRLVKELIEINKHELQLLEANFSASDEGLEFMDSSHPYCDDLNLFGRGSLFQLINRTTSVDGKNKLAEMMKSMSVDPLEIKRQQEAIKELSSLSEWRQTFRAVGNLIQESSFKKETIVQWFKNNPHKLDGLLFKTTIYILPIINIILIALFSFNVVNSTIGFSFVLVLLLTYGGYSKTVNWYSRSLELFSTSIKKYDALLSSLQSIEFTSHLPNQIKKELIKDNVNAYTEIRKAKKLLNRLESRNNIIVAILFNGLYLRDLHTLKAIDTWQKENLKHFPKWFDAIANLDALNSLAGFSFNHPNFVLPECSNNTLLRAKDLGHPLIDAKERVDNDISYESSSFFYIVTGANMAGKSTFLRTVSVNIIMASLGLPVCAKQFTYKPVKLFTSIGTFDDLIAHTSYFKAELLRLKKLYDSAVTGEPLFIVLDEILKGTNSEDKRKGSIGVLKKLIKEPVYGLVATHDLDLGKLSTQYPESFKNICFEISFQEDQMSFDYKLRDGITQNMNASYLLENMGLI